MAMGHFCYTTITGEISSTVLYKDNDNSTFEMRFSISLRDLCEYNYVYHIMDSFQSLYIIFPNTNLANPIMHDIQAQQHRRLVI